MVVKVGSMWIGGSGTAAATAGLVVIGVRCGRSNCG